MQFMIVKPDLTETFPYVEEPVLEDRKKSFGIRSRSMVMTSYGSYRTRNKTLRTKKRKRESKEASDMKQAERRSWCLPSDGAAEHQSCFNFS